MCINAEEEKEIQQSFREAFLKGRIQVIFMFIFMCVFIL